MNCWIKAALSKNSLRKLGEEVARMLDFMQMLLLWIISV
jgi:hypothetical protein